MALITISRHKGCGGIEIAKMVAKELNLELYDDRKLREEALHMGLKADELKGFDTKAPGFFDRIMRSKPQLFMDLMASVIYEVAKRCHGVIIGHGSQRLLRDFDCALHVHIYGSMKKRIAYMVEEQGLSPEAAEKLLTKSDNKRKSYIRFAFGDEWDNPKLYDIIINRDKLLPDTAAKIIIDAARSGEIGVCGLKASESMGRLALLKKIEAEVLRNNFNINLLHIEVPQTGTVNVWGYTETQEEIGRLKKVIGQIPGVKKSEYDVSIVDMNSD
jgi:cytidylate kinase